MVNNRLKLNEAENAVGLQDLLDLSQKVQTSVLALQNGALKFNDRRLMELATKLASDGGDFHKYISHLVMEAGGQQGIMKQQAELEQSVAPPQQQNLNAPTNTPTDTGTVQQLESAKARYLKRKKLKESEDTQVYMNEEDNDEPKKVNGEVVIDLSEPFEKAIDGLDDKEFNTFKSDVVSKLEDHIDTVENKVSAPAADEFVKSVEALGAAKSSEDFDFALNNLYDFADKHEIIVETVKKTKQRI
jgi:hypothetical protein